MRLRPVGAGHKSGGRQANNWYVNVDQLHIDAKVEAVLCMRGPKKYELVDNSGVTVPWLLEHFVLEIRSFYDQYNTISEVLAMPLLLALR
jgi:hypothetical protein